MKRRRFIQNLAVTPAAALPLLGEIQAQPVGPQNRAAEARPADESPKLEISTADSAAAGTVHFFSAMQLSALRKLSDLVMPALNDLPGALDAGAPEFLDFLIGVAPVERQQVYKTGLDLLNAQAQRQFKKPFAELDAAQANGLLAPLRQPWTYEPSPDALTRFLVDAKQDIRTATTNSREYVMASASGGRRGGGVGQYWYPID